jgi:hypothetical protein
MVDLMMECLCGIVVRVPMLQTQRSQVRFPALPDFLAILGLERCPLSFMRINEELFKEKVAAPV